MLSLVMCSGVPLDDIDDVRVMSQLRCALSLLHERKPPHTTIIFSFLNAFFCFCYLSPDGCLLIQLQDPFSACSASVVSILSQCFTQLTLLRAPSSKVLLLFLFHFSMGRCKLIHFFFNRLKSL
jgi:hypothetical protein